MAGKKGMHDGRSPAYAQAIRERIQAGVIVDSLQKHAAGQKKLTASQVTAGLGLLRKVVPDLSTTTVVGDDQQPIVMRWASKDETL